MSKVKVALVCDWLLNMGGAERVVYELHKLYPDAPIYTSQLNRDPKAWYGWDWLDEADIRTGWLQRLPAGLKKFMPILRAWYFSNLKLEDYDVVISISGAEAKGVKVGPNTIHLSYCHSPTHYYWFRYEEYLNRPGFPRGTNWLARLGLKALVAPLRQWDRHAAKQPDLLIANSTHTQSMIKKYYRRDSVVIFPPVDTGRFKIKGNPPTRHGFVVAGRQTPYKRIDLAVEACSRLKLPLLVIGNGPEHKRLEKMAGRTVTFLTGVNEEDLARHFQSSLALLFPTNVEDFGVTAIEAMAAGTPVIAYQKGGPQDYITPKTGLFFKQQTVESLIKAIESFSPGRYDPSYIRNFSEQFSAATFANKINALVNDELKKKV